MHSTILASWYRSVWRPLYLTCRGTAAALCRVTD